MLKRTQKRIIFAVIFLMFLVLLATGFLIYNQQIEYNKILEELEISKGVKSTNYFNLFITISLVFLIISVLVSNILSKTILLPIQELVHNAQLILKGDTLQRKSLKADKEKDQIDDLVEMFSDMNADLKDNLQEITRKKNEIETILFHMTDGVISFDIYGRITHINPAAKKALNITEKTKFKYVFEKIGVEPNIEKLMYMEKLAKSKIVYTNEEGNIYNILFDFLKTNEDKMDGIVVVIQDITEHVNLDQMRKQFVADVSHELKTPITSIMGYSETILDNLPDEETLKHFVKRMNTEAQRMSELVTDLLILSKYDKANTEKAKEAFDITEVVKDYTESLKKEAEKKKIELNCFVTSNVPKIHGDKSGIIRVFTNILSNAIKYTGENGKIEIYVGFLYKDAYVKIKDNGIGIKESDLAKVFERFYRVDSSRVRKSGGSGLRIINC